MSSKAAYEPIVASHIKGHPAYNPICGLCLHLDRSSCVMTEKGPMYGCKLTGIPRLTFEKCIGEKK